MQQPTTSEDALMRQATPRLDPHMDDDEEKEEEGEEWRSSADLAASTTAAAPASPVRARFFIRTFHCPILPVQTFDTAASSSTLNAQQAGAVAVAIIQHLLNELGLLPAPWPQVEDAHRQLLASAGSSIKRPSAAHRQFLKMVTSLQHTFECIHRVFESPVDELNPAVTKRLRTLYPHVEEVMVAIGASLYRPAIIYRFHIGYAATDPPLDSTQQAREIGALTRRVVQQLMNQADRLLPLKRPSGLNSEKKRMHVLFRLNRRADLELRLRQSMLALGTQTDFSAAPAAAAAAASPAAGAASSGASGSFFSDEQEEGRDRSRKSATATDGHSSYTKNLVPMTEYAHIRMTDILRTGPRLQNSFSFKRPVSPPLPPFSPSAPSAASTVTVGAASSRARRAKPKRVRVFKEPTPSWCLPYTLLIGNPAERAQMLAVYGDHEAVEDMDMDGGDRGEDDGMLDDAAMQASPQPLAHAPSPAAAAAAAQPATAAFDGGAEDANPLYWYQCTQSATFSSGKGIF